jgi:hypothetical protein
MPVSILSAYQDLAEESSSTVESRMREGVTEFLKHHDRLKPLEEHKKSKPKSRNKKTKGKRKSK